MAGTEHLERNTVEVLRAAGSQKWTTYPDTLPAWVAEMDFGCAPPIVRALHEAMDSRVFGYLPPGLKADMSRACAGWLRERFGWEIPAANVRPINDVMAAFEHTILSFTPADRPAVIVPTPAYSLFLSTVRALDRPVIELPLVRDGDRYVFDLEALDAAFAAGAGLLTLCDPHNPTGTVYTPEEHRQIAKIVESHGARVFSDEIHAPLVYSGHAHVPYAASCPEAAGHTITSLSAAKGWNVAGLKAAQIIFSNDADLELWNRIGGNAERSPGTLGVIAAIAAYTEGGPWLDDVTRYLEDARDHVLARFAAEMPRVGITKPEGTYFGWLDMRAYGLGPHPAEVLRERTAVSLIDGGACGAGHEGFLRLNFATPRPILDQVIDRIGAAL